MCRLEDPLKSGVCGSEGVVEGLRERKYAYESSCGFDLLADSAEW